MTVYKETEVKPMSRTEFLLGLLLIGLIFFTLGLSVGRSIGIQVGHDRVCNSPQVPFVAPVNIPACK